jgi:secreted trypsin-like serine protease
MAGSESGRIAAHRLISSRRRVALLAALGVVTGLSCVAPGAALALALPTAPAAEASGSSPSHVLSSALRRRLDRALRRRAGGHPTARAAIVNGTAISIGEAPWQVAVFAEVQGGEILCGGSIVDATHILTAAHCVFDPTTHERLAPASFVVLAGTADITLEGFEHEPSAQARLVSGVRPHPYYSPTEALPAADDVAVLSLAQPLVESPGGVQPIALSPAETELAEGTTTELSGFGEQNGVTHELNGHLYAISMSTTFPRRCGGEADALYVCASTPSGSLCSGDSGGALTLSGSPATVVGVVNTVQVISGEACRDGAGGGFANVAAPEIRDFILGSESPPRAPRGGNDVVVRGVVRADAPLTCEPGTWSNDPTLTYTFVDSADGARLQSGPAQVYLLTPGDVGRTIFCEVQATTAGGIGSVRTEALPPVQPAFPPLLVNESGALAGASTAGAPGAVAPLPAPGQEGVVVPESSKVLLGTASLSVKSNGTAMAKLECLGFGECAGKLSLTARRTIKVAGRRFVRAVPVAPTTGFSIVEGNGDTVGIKLDALGRSLLAAARGHLPARLTITQLKPAPALQTTRAVELVRPEHSNKG